MGSTRLVLPGIGAHRDPLLRSPAHGRSAAAGKSSMDRICRQAESGDCLPAVPLENDPMLKKTLTVLILSAFTLATAASLTACNTVEGAGKDVQAGGKAIKDEANEHK